MILTCALLLQTGILHQSKHSIEFKNNCHFCFTQADIGTGLLPQSIELDAHVVAVLHITHKPNPFQSQQLNLQRNRSPPHII